MELHQALVVLREGLSATAPLPWGGTCAACPCSLQCGQIWSPAMTVEHGGLWISLRVVLSRSTEHLQPYPLLLEAYHLD